MKRHLSLISASLAVVAFSSCSGGFQETAATRLDTLAKFSFTDLMPSKVPVVEVREDQLKEMPLGSERALAFEQKQNQRRLASFRAPATFREPVLPVVTNPQAGFGVLPPRPQ